MNQSLLRTRSRGIQPDDQPTTMSADCRLVGGRALSRGRAGVGGRAWAGKEGKAQNDSGGVGEGMITGKVECVIDAQDVQSVGRGVA